MRSLEMGCLEQGEPRAPHPGLLHPTSRRAAPELGLAGLGGHCSVTGSVPSAQLSKSLSLSLCDMGHR